MSMTMRCVTHAPGAPLGVAEVARPELKAGEIVIAVAAAGINRPDLLQRDGLYPAPAGASPTLGLEAAGTVAAVGAGVARWREGDPVTALLNGGGYAEFVAVPAGAALPIPPGLSMVEAAALPETVFTVWANLFESCALKPGETALIHGGASGIGTTAIQMAAAHGARVFATAGSAEKCALCVRLGAARAFNYRETDFEAGVLAEGGADAVLDMVGGGYISKNINVLKQMGRMAFIAFLEGSRAEVDFMRVMLKRLTITGSTLRSRPDAEKARLAQAVEAAVWPWIAAGRVKPVIDAVFPLEEAEAAMARMRSGAHAGKIVLEVGAP